MGRRHRNLQCWTCVHEQERSKKVKAIQYFGNACTKASSTLHSTRHTTSLPSANTKPQPFLKLLTDFTDRITILLIERGSGWREVVFVRLLLSGSRDWYCDEADKVLREEMLVRSKGVGRFLVPWSDGRSLPEDFGAVVYVELRA